MRIVHYSVQGNHLHLLVEVDCTDKTAAKRALTKAMQGLGVRLARRLNKVLGRRGRLIEERYHVTRLTTPQQVKNALLYILNNGRKHRAERGLPCEADWLDPCATGVYFEHWREQASGIAAWQSWVRQLDETLGPKAGPRSIVAPRSWLLKIGWHKHGPLPLAAIPGQGSRGGTKRSRR